MSDVKRQGLGVGMGRERAAGVELEVLGGDYAGRTLSACHPSGAQV